MPLVSIDYPLGSCFMMQRSLLCWRLGSLAAKYKLHAVFFFCQIIMIAFYPRHLDTSREGALKWVLIVFQYCTMGSCFTMQRFLLCRQLGSLAGKYELHAAFTLQVMMIFLEWWERIVSQYCPLWTALHNSIFLERPGSNCFTSSL